MACHQIGFFFKSASLFLINLRPQFGYHCFENLSLCSSKLKTSAPSSVSLELFSLPWFYSFAFVLTLYCPRLIWADSLTLTLVDSHCKLLGNRCIFFCCSLCLFLLLNPRPYSTSAKIVPRAVPVSLRGI